MAPPNMGIDFTTKFKDIFPKIADESKALLIPFLLEGVAAIPSLNQADGIHPNPQGHKIVAENVWKVQRALESSGVIFIEENDEGPGVRLRKIR